MAIYLHVCHGTWSGFPWSFTLHTSGALAVGDAEGGWSSAIGEWWTDADGLYTSDVKIIETTTATLDQPTGKQITKAMTAHTLAGVDVAGVLLPPQLAVVVSLRTSLASRAGRGRFFLPGPSSGALSAGKLSAATVGTLSTAVGTMFAALSASSLQPVLYSRKAHTVNDVISYDIGNVMDTQRRRRDGLTETRVSGNV